MSCKMNRHTNKRKSVIVGNNGSGPRKTVNLSYRVFDTLAKSATRNGLCCAGTMFQE